MNGLQLLDLGYEVEYIEIDTSKVPYNFAVKLGDRTFTFCIRWNDVGGFFTAAVVAAPIPAAAAFIVAPPIFPATPASLAKPFCAPCKEDLKLLASSPAIFIAME